MRLKFLGAVVAFFALVPGSLAADQQISASPDGTSFSPSEVTVNVGDTVTVSRASGGAFAHNVHYDDQVSGCPAGGPVTNSWSCPRTFSTTGDYKFHCDLHTFMTGTVHVVGSGTTGPTGPSPGPSPNPPAKPLTSTPTLKTVPLGQIARLPKGCARRRSYRIRLRRPAELSSAKVFVNRKRVAALKGAKLTTRIKVRGLPAKGRFALKIEVTRVDGSRLVGKRRVRTCSSRKT